MACLNRSLANLRLQRPEKALADATRGSDSDAPSEKELFRQARSLYELGDFEKALGKLQEVCASHPGNTLAALEMERAKTRLHEKTTGEYDFRHMHKQAEQTPPVIDCATFSARVEVRDSPGKGLGLFTTVPVSAGELLLCEKAVGYTHAELKQGTALYTDTSTSSNVAIITDILSMSKAESMVKARLVEQLVQKLYHGHSRSREFKELHCGGYTTVPDLEVDGVPVVDS